MNFETKLRHIIGIGDKHESFYHHESVVGLNLARSRTPYSRKIPWGLPLLLLAGLLPSRLFQLSPREANHQYNRCAWYGCVPHARDTVMA